MMNRREALLRSAGLIAIGTVAMPSIANEHRPHPIDYALRLDLWADPMNLYRDRRLAAAFAQLRIVYEGPTRSDNYSNTVLSALADAFGRDPDSNVNKIANVHQALEDSRNSDEIRHHMAERLSASEEQFDGWLNSIGVQGQPLRADLLNAQAVFAAAAAVNLAEDQSTFEQKFSWLGRFTWIWPFC